MSEAHNRSQEATHAPGAAAPEATRAKTARGRATEAGLVRAARKVFERDGFLDARISDITAAAGTALGSFYNYFEGKEEIFSAVIAELSDEGLHPPVLDYLGGEALERFPAAIAGHHHEYLQAYARNYKLMRAMEQLTNISDSFRRRRRDEAQPFVRASARAIRQLQSRGDVDASLDPVMTTRALSAMVSRSAYITFILEEDRGKRAIEQLAVTLTELWLGALGIPHSIR